MTQGSEGMWRDLIYKAPIWIAGHALRESQLLGDGVLYSHCLGYPKNKKDTAPQFEQLKV
jgi:hypothetical protein